MEATQAATLDAQIEKLTLSAESPANTTLPKLPTVLLVLGMAGSGKTTFVHVSSISIDNTFLKRLIAHLSEKGKKTYNINLDPAVLQVKFPVHVDIRDSVKYKNIMKSYKLGK